MGSEMCIRDRFNSVGLQYIVSVICVDEDENVLKAAGLQHTTNG